jgi:two-component system chemotaxis sensor kinase CheA
VDPETLEIVVDFVTESRETLQEVEPLLIELEQTSSGTPDFDTLNKIFRLVHSMKGVASFLEFDHIAKVTHHAETLLDELRRGTVNVEPRHMTVLIKTLDLIGVMLGKVEADQSDAACGEDTAKALAILAGAKDQATAAAGMPAATSSISGAGSAATSLDAALAGATSAAALAAPATVAAPSSAMPPAAQSAQGQMSSQFVQESCELVDTFEEALLAAETDADRAENIQQAFRAIHSFKGNCGFLGYADMQVLAHRMEEVLDSIREGRTSAEPSVFGGLLALVDKLRVALRDVSEGGTGAIPLKENLLRTLDLLFDGGGGGKTPNSPGPVIDLDGPLPGESKPARSSRPSDAAASASPPSSNKGQDGAGKTDDKGKRKSQPQAQAQASIRVDLDKLDSLINMVGELIIASATVTHNPELEGLEIPNFFKSAQRLDRITRSLHDIAMSVRMIPVATTFRRMLRLARDLSQKQKKSVELVISGEETEVDKTVIEQIGDPLVHIIRNAIDHGVESPEERAKAGKPKKATVQLLAKHHGGEVWIQISDDGRGLARDKILEKARSRGLVDGDRSELKDGEVYALIFEPGFSTAEQVTDVSGRGVGMDVVKRNIEKLKGRVDVSSQPGQGSTFTLRIPLTLAIIDGMLVRVGRTFYTIPLLAIRESFRARPEDLTILADGQEMVRIRDELFPIVRLHHLHKLPHDYERIEDGILMILEEKDDRVCVFVDEVLGQRQTVIKALSRYLGQIRGLSGCSILGSGDISLILDVNNLVDAVRQGYEPLHDADGADRTATSRA